jgi:hypothetical protein
MMLVPASGGRAIVRKLFLIGFVVRLYIPVQRIQA